MSGGLSVIRQELHDISGSARDLRVGVNHLALEQECQRQESTLRRLRQIQSQLSKSRYSDSQLEASAQELADILNLNADVLRYLDGISNLEQPISSLTNTICRSAAAISHPDAAPLTVFANKNLGDSISNCWEYISQLSDLAQFHLRAAASYQKFHHNKNELKAQIQKNVDLAEEKMRLFNPHGTVDEAVRLATELQDQFNHFNQMWEDTRQLSVTSRSLLPLNLRMAEVRGGKVENSQLPQTVMVKVLINIRDSSFQVHKDEELLLVDNSDPIYWTVQTAQGPRQLPSVALSVIGPYSDGVFDMNKLQSECALGWVRSLERMRGRLLQYYTELFDSFCQSESVYFRNKRAMDAFLDDLERILIFPNYDGGRLAKSYEKFMRTIILQQNGGKAPRDGPILRDIDITHMHAPLRKISDQEKYVQQVQSQLSMNAEEVSRYLRDVEQERQRISTELADMERMQKNQEMQIRSLSQRMQQWRSTKHLMDRTVNEYLSAPTQDSVGSEAQTSEVTRDLIQGYPMTALPRLREIDRIGAVRPGDDESLPPQPPPPLRKPKLAEFDGQPSLHKSRSTTQFDFSARVREAPGPSLAVIRCQTQDSRSFVFQQSVVPRQAMVALGAKETRDINTFVGVVNQPANVQVDLDDLSQYEMVSCAARTTDSALKRSVSTSDLQTQILLVKNNSSTQYEPTREGEGSLRWNKGDFSTTRPRLKSGNQEYVGQRPKTADVQAQICKNVRDRGSQVGVIVIPTEIDISRVELDNLGLEVQPSRESAALGLRVGTVLCPATIGQTMELHDGPGIEVLGFNDVNSMRVRHGNMLATAVSQPSRDVETQIMTVQKSSRSQCDSFEDSTTGSEGTPGRSSSSGDVQTQIGILKHTASVQAVAAMQVVEVPSFTAKKTIASGTVEATTKLTILPESITMTTEEQYERPAKSEEDMEKANDVMTQIGCLLHSRGLHTDLRTYLSEYASRIGTLQTTQVDLTTQIGLVKHEQYQTEMSQQANLSGRTADLQTQILPVVTEEGTQVARTGALKLTSISHGKTSAKTMGSTSASAPRGGDQVETMISRHFSDCSTQVSTKLIPTEISLSKIALSTTEVSFKKNQQLERLEVPADSIIYPGKIKYDTQLTEDGSSIEVTDVSEVSRFLVTNEDQVILANLKSTSGDAQTQIFTLDKERDLQGAMVLSSFSSDDNGLKPNVDLQTQIGRWVDNKVITKDSKEQTFPSYASGLCTQCKCKLQDLQTQVSALDVPEMLSSEEDTAPRRNADGTVSVGPIREIESWTTKVGSKSTADNMNQIYSVNKNASVQVGVELTPTKIAMARCDTENTQIMATDRSELDSEQADCVASLDAILCPARMQVTTRLVDGASGFQLIPVSQTEMVTLSVDNAGLDPKFTSSAFATPRKSTEAVGTGLDVTLNDELDAYLVLGSQSKNPAVAKEKVLRRLLTKTVDSSPLRLVPIVGSFVSESGLRPSVPLTDTMCQIFKVVTDAQVQVGSRLVPQELSLSKVGMENLELNLKNRKSFTDIQIQIDSLLYPLEVKMSTELCEQAGITIARLDEVDQVSINTSSVADDTVVNGSDGLEAEVTRTSRVHQPQMSDLQTQILHADTRPTMGSVMVVDPGKASSASGKSSGASVAEVSCLLKDQKSEKRLCIVSMPAEHTTESSRHSANYIGRVLTNEIALLAKGPYTTVEVTNQNRRGRDEGCQVGVRMIPTSVDLSRLHVENLSVELNRPEHKERLKLAVGSFLCPANIQMKSELHDGSGVCIQGLKDTTEIALRTSTENRKEGLQEVAPGQEPSTAVQPKKKGLLTGLWHSISHSKADSAVISQSGTVTPGKSATSVSSTLPSEEFHQGVSSTANDVYLYAAAVVQPTEEEEEGDELRALQEAIQSGTVETKFKIGALKFGKDTRPVSGAFDGIKELGVLRMVHSSSRERREHAMQVGVCMVPEEIMISSINLENVNLEVKSPEQAESLNLRAGSILYPAEMKLRTELREETSGITLATMTDIGSIQMNDGERLLNGTIEMRADGKQPDAINLRGSGGYRYDLQTQVGPITADVKIPAALVAEPPAVTPMPGLPLFGSTQTVSRMLKTEEMQAKRTTLTVNNQRPHGQLGVVEASLAQVCPSFKQQTTDIRLAEVKEMNLIMPSADNIRRAEEQVARPRVTTRDASHQVGAVLVPTQIKLEEMRLDASQLETETRRAISNLDLPQDTAFCATDMQLNTVLTESAGISLVNMKVVSDIGVQWSKGMCVADLVHSKNEPIQTCLRLRSGTVPSLAGVYQSVDQIRSEVLSVPSNGALTQVASVTKKEALGQPGTSAHRRKQCDAVEFGAQVGLILVPTKIQMEHIGVDNLELSLARENGTNVQGVDNVRISKDIAVSAVLCCSDVEMTPVLTTAPGIQVANLRELDEIGIQVKDEICMAHINRSGLQNRMYIGNYAGRMQEKVSGQKTGGEVDIRTNTASIEKRNIGHDTVAETNTMKSNTFTYTQEGRISQRDEEFRKLYEAIKEGKAEVRLRVLNERTGATCLQTLNTQISNPSASQEKETQSVEGIIPRKKISTLDFSTQAGSMLIPAVVDMKRIDLQGAELTLKSASSVASHELNIPVASVICANTSELQSVLTTDSGLQIMSPAEAQSRNFQPHTKDVVTTAIGQWASTDRGTETAALRHLAQLSMQAPQSLKENMIITMPATAVLRGQNAIHAGMMASMNLQSGSTPSETDSLTNERIVALLRSSTSSKRLHITSGSVCHSDNLGGGRLVSQRSVKDLAEEINRGSQSAIDSFVSASGTRVASGGQQAPRSIQVIEQFPGTSITLRSAVSHPDTSTTLGTYISRSGTLMCEASMQVGTVLLPTKIHMNPTDTQILENTPPEAQTIVTEATNVSAGSLLVPSTVEMTSALAEVSGIHLVGVSDVSHVAVQMEGDMLFGEAEKNPSKEQGGGQFQTMIRMLHGLHTTDGSDSTMQPMTFQVTVDESRTRDTMQVSGSTKTATAAYSSQPRLATYTCACGRTYATSDFVPQPLLTSAEDRRVTASRLETVSSQSAAPMWPGSVTTAVSQFNVACDASIMPHTFNKGVSARAESDSLDRTIQIGGAGPSEYPVMRPTTADMLYAPAPSTNEVPREFPSTVDFSTQAGSMLIPAVVDMKRIDLQGAELTLKSASSVASHELNIPVASVICANTSELQSVLTTDSGLQIMSPAEAQSRNFQPHTKDVVTTAIGQWASTDRGTETAALRHLAQLSMQAPQSLKENMIITMPATAVLRGQNAIHAGMMASMNLQSGSTPSETDSLTNERIVALLRSSTSSKRLHITSGSVCHSDNLGGGRLVSQRSVKDLAEEINRGSQSAIDSFVSASGTRVASGGQQAPRSIQVIEQFPGTSITLRSAVSHPDTSTTLGTYISRSGTLMCEASMQVGTVLLPTKIHMNPTDTQILENTPPEAQTIVTEATNVSAGSLLVPSTVEMTSALAEVSGIHLVGVSDVSHVAVQMEGDMLFGEAEKNPSKEQGGGQFQTMIRMLHGLHTTDGSDSTMQPMTFQVTVDESRTRDTMQVSGSTKTATAAYSSQPRLATYTCACGRTYATSDFVPQPLLTSAEDRRVTASRLETVSSQSAAPMWPGSVTTAVSQFHVAADTLFSPSSSFVNKLSGKQNPVTVDNFMQCSEVDASDLQETIILMTCGMDVHTFPLSCMSPTQVIGQPNSSTSTRNPAVQSDASVQCAVLTRQDLLSLRFHPSTAVNTLSAISPGLVAGDLALLRPTNQIGQNAAPDEKREVGYYSKHAAADTQPVPMCTVCQQRNVSDCLQSMPGRDTREIPTQSIRQNISSQGRRMDLLSERAALTDQQDAATDIDPLKALTDQAAYVHDGQVERYIEALTNAEAQQLSTVVVAARKMMQKTFSTTGRLTGVSTYERLKEHNMVKLLVTEYDADRRSKMNWAQTQTEQMPNTIAGAGGETQRLEASLGGPSPPIKIVRSEKTKKSDVYSSSISSGSDEEEYLTQATVRPWPMRPRSKDYCDVACTAQIAPESLEKRIQVTEEAIQAASQPWMPNPPDSPTGR